MTIFGRKKVVETAQEIIEHLRLVDNVKALQSDQRLLSDALASLSDRVRQLESEMRILKVETKSEALKQTVDIVNGVQGSLNQRIETLAIKVALIEGGGTTAKTIPGGH